MKKESFKAGDKVWGFEEENNGQEGRGGDRKFVEKKHEDGTRSVA